MLDPTWSALALFALAGGVLVILTPRLIVDVSNRLNRMVGSMDDLIMKHRHVVGAALLVVAYLCFRLALLVPHGM